MYQKQIKDNLKSAKESIKNKQFDEAIQLCKNILVNDPNNYNAMVFQGAALFGCHQVRKALEIYKIAATIDPLQCLAWQGICNVYEKSEEEFSNSEKEEFVKSYEKLFNLMSDDKKKFEIGLKMAETNLSLKCYDQSVLICKHLMILDTSIEEECSLLPVHKILSFTLPLATDKDDELLERCCKSVIDSQSSDMKDKTHCWQQFLNCLIVKKEHDVSQLWKLCLDSACNLDEPIFQWELMCHLYLDKADDLIESFDLTSAFDGLNRLKPESLWLQLIDGHKKMMIEKDLNAAQTLLAHCLETCSIGGHSLYAQCLLGLHHSINAANVIDKTIALLQKKDCVYFGCKDKILSSLRFLLAQSLLEQSSIDKWKRAVDICFELIGSDSKRIDVKICLGNILLKLKEFTRAKKVADEVLLIPKTPEILLFLGIYYFTEQNLHEARKSFLEAIEIKNNSYLNYYHLGCLYLNQLQNLTEESNSEEDLKMMCLQSLMQAAKLDPFFCNTFVCLGQFYQQIILDTSKAKRCYEKAIELDNDNDAAGIELFNCLLNSGDKEIALKFLLSITELKGTNSPKWVWLRLGLHQMKYGDPTESISSFQMAIKKDSKDVHCWECLGDAFLNRGSYNSAFKVFTKVTEISPENLHAFYQLADIKQKLGLYAEAVDQYKLILEKSNNYVPALQGLSQANLQLCKLYVNRLLYGRAIDHCQEAINFLTRVAKMRPDMSCIWKQLGDAFTIIHTIPSQLLRIQIPSELLNDENNSSSDSSLNKRKKELLALGARCYGMALKLQPDMSSLWHDLGINYFYQVKVVDKFMVKSYAMKSLQALRKAVAIDTSNHEHWTVLGVISASQEVSDPAFAQHCFIRSIQNESNNVLAWTNLGTLYLNNNQMQLAHEAFKVAQSLEPSYVNSWIGQAFIAESFSDDDTMDLFRHATELNDNLEACIGYSHWVCLTLKDNSKMSSEWYRYTIEHLNAVTAASDAMAKYTQCCPDDAVAWNMYGLLLERQQLNKTSVHSFERSLSLLMKSRVNEKDSVLVDVMQNYARLLCKTRNYEKSIENYESCDPSSSFNVSVGLGMSFLKNGKTDESIQAYQVALDLAAKDKDINRASENQSLVYVAMGMAEYMANNLDSAKTHFFHSIKGFSCFESHLALLCLAIFTRDFTIITAVLQKLQEMQLTTNQSSDLVSVTSYIRLIQGDKKMAMLELLKNIHIHPNNSENWIKLSKFLIVLMPENEESAKQCSRVALQGHVKNHEMALQCYSLTALSASFSCDAFRAAQKVVHLRPEILSNWCLLLSSSHLQNVSSIASNVLLEELQKFTKTLSTHIMSLVELELTHGGHETSKSFFQSIHLWCVRQYSLVLFITNELQSALRFLEKATWLYDEDLVLSRLIAFLKQDDSTLKNLMKDDHLTVAASQILLAWFLMKDLSSDAHLCYKEWLQKSRLLNPLLSSSTTKIQSVVARCLLQIHLNTENNIDLQDLLATARKEKDEEFIEFYNEAIKE